jgi:hypothetical protein
MAGRAILFAAALIGGAPASASQEKVPAVAVALREAAEALQQQDCPRALKAIRKAKATPEFKQNPHVMSATLNISAVCLAAEGDSEGAYRELIAATALPEADDLAWRLRLMFEFENKRTDAALTTMELLQRGRGAVLNAMPVQWFYQTDNALKRTGSSTQRRRFLAVLADESYHPDDPGVTNDGFRYPYATLLFEAGERDAAFAMARSIESPSLLVDLALDPNFRALTPGDPDIRRAVERKLAEAREVAARNPDHIGPVNDIATYLRVLGKPKEALAALDTIRARIEGKDELADRDEQAIWWWDQQSRAHQMNADCPAAFAALRSGGALRENGGDNVSQTINLASLQVRAGDPAGALKTLVPFETSTQNTSPYGAMQVAIVRGCAHAKLTGPAAAAADIAFVRAHAKDASDGLTRVLLCAGDLDGAAASMIARLADPDERTMALRDLSDFDAPPVPLPADPYRDAYRAMKDRADVRAAAAAAGGTRRFNVQDTSF